MFQSVHKGWYGIPNIFHAGVCMCICVLLPVQIGEVHLQTMKPEGGTGWGNVWTQPLVSATKLSCMCLPCGPWLCLFRQPSQQFTFVLWWLCTHYDLGYISYIGQFRPWLYQLFTLRQKGCACPKIFLTRTQWPLEITHKQPGANYNHLRLHFYPCSMSIYIYIF